MSVSNHSSYHRYTTELNEGKIEQLNSTSPFQQQHRRNLSSVSIANTVNLLHASYPLSISSMANSTALQNLHAKASHSNNNLTSITLPSPELVGLSISNSDYRNGSSAYAHLPKQWLCNSNFLYSHTRPLQDGLFSHPSHLSGLFANKTKEINEHANHCEGSLQKIVDLSSSSYCSDDSFDVSDGKISPVNSTPPTAHTNTKNPSEIPATLTSKKRNPYSIEELLKPKKRTRIEPITFQPAILTHKIDRDSPVSPANDDSDHNCQSNNNITIEVCD